MRAPTTSPAPAATSGAPTRPAGDLGLTALVALRDPGEGKTRLAPALSHDQRAEVARAMARDVLDALQAAGTCEVVVLARGDRAARFARSLGVAALRDRDPHAGLNVALTDALRAVGDDRTRLVVCADLPGLAAGDVATVAAVDAEVVVAPTRGGGTGGLLLRPGVHLDPAFGARSAAAHRQRSRRAGRRTAQVSTAGFHHDVDEPADLHAAARRWPDSHTARTVRGWSPARVLAGGPPPRTTR